MIGTFGYKRSKFKGSFALHGCLAGSPNGIKEEELAKKYKEYKSFVSSL